MKSSSFKKPNIVLVLQGGGALGAYHIGAYQAMQEAGFTPDWVSGTSIGAINAAIISGNHPTDQIGRLEELWDGISRPNTWLTSLDGSFPRLSNIVSNMQALMLGQPNFFMPRFANPYLAPAGDPCATSYYDTSPLLGTLVRLVGFDLINSKKTRLSLGATRVETGQVVYFDNTRQPIGPEHVLASGSLPPGFPAVSVDGAMYWDGGCVSNTPLEAILQDQPSGHTVVFMIDLWAAQGAVPRTMDEVLWRQKQIQYASRTAQHIDAVATKLNLMRAMNPKRGDAADRMDIVHITYQPASDQISSSDAEFSRSSIAERRTAGYEDLMAALSQAPWFSTEKPTEICALVHQVRQGDIRTLAPVQPRTTPAVFAA
jgi:NTE family protein